MNKTLFVVGAALVFNLVSCSKNDPPKHQLPSPVQSYRTAPMVPVDTNAVWGVMYTYRSSRVCCECRDRQYAAQWHGRRYEHQYPGNALCYSLAKL